MLKKAADEYINIIKRKTNTLTNKLENKIESKSYNIFKHEYMDSQYLDMLLGDKTTFLTINLIKDNNGDISIESNIKKRLKTEANSIHTFTNKTSPTKDLNLDLNTNNTEEDLKIKKDKIMLNMIDNPKL